MIGTKIRAALAATGLLAAFTLPAAAQTSGTYVRATVGYGWSGATLLQDRVCTNPTPYNILFGCGAGFDGLTPIGARGSFGSSGVYEIGIGTYAAPAIRVEAVFGVRPGFAFAGMVNYPGKAAGPQPMTATAGQMGVMGFVYADLGTMMGRSGPVQPYVGFGLGVSRNAIGEGRMEFPMLDQPRYSLVPGGVNYDMAVAVAAGLAYRAHDRLTIDLGWRWTRFGVVETERGVMFNQFSDHTSTLLLDHIWGVLKGNEVTLSVRWAL